MFLDMNRIIIKEEKKVTNISPWFSDANIYKRTKLSGFTVPVGT